MGITAILEVIEGSCKNIEIGYMLSDGKFANLSEDRIQTEIAEVTKTKEASNMKQ